MTEEHIQEFLSSLLVYTPTGEHLVTFFGIEESNLHVEKTATGKIVMDDKLLAEMVENAVATLWGENDTALFTLRTFLDRGRNGASEMRGWELSNYDSTALTADSVEDNLKHAPEAWERLDSDARKVTFCDAWECLPLLSFDDVD
jgi:hypothetical protein